MTKNEVIVRKYVADEGKVFDWAEPRYEDGIQSHLYARTIYLAANDDISNYIEVAANEDTE